MCTTVASSEWGGNGVESSGNVALGCCWCCGGNALVRREFRRASIHRLCAAAGAARPAGAASRLRRLRLRASTRPCSRGPRRRSIRTATRSRARDFIGIVDFSKPSSEARFHVVDLMNGDGRKPSASPTARGSDPDHSGFLERFSNEFGSYATSNGAYTTGDYYHGKYGLSMKIHGLDWTNNNAEAARHRHSQRLVCRARNALRSTASSAAREGCFAFSRAEPMGGDAQARRRPHDLRRQTGLVSLQEGESERPWAQERESLRPIPGPFSFGSAGRNPRSTSTASLRHPRLTTDLV